MIVFEKHGRTQQVEERERQRIAILERMGWVRSEQAPVEVESTSAEGYSAHKTDADLARNAAQDRKANNKRTAQPTVATLPTVDTTAQRTITGQQPTVAKTGDLPADFPGYDALREAGIGTDETLRNVTDLSGVKGVGKATATKISAALADDES